MNKFASYALGFAMLNFASLSKTFADETEVEQVSSNRLIVQGEAPAESLRVKAPGLKDLGSIFVDESSVKKDRTESDVEVLPEESTVSGSLTKEEVNASIRANVNLLRKCYVEFLKETPDAKGGLEIHFTVTPTGEASPLSISSNTLGDGIEDCVKSKIGRIKFPSPRDGNEVSVAYPFSFHTK